MIKLNEKFLSPFVRANEVAQMEAELEAARKTVMDKSGAGSDFLGWLDKRQNGSGNVFYQMKTAESQNFINYYTITSVNVYDVDEYKALAGIQQ